ncbi:hypothetical protein ACFLR1_02425 [Bacteroidota bacterium]
MILLEINILLIEALIKWVSVFLSFYLGFLLIMRVSKYYKIKVCPYCGSELKRTQRTPRDKAIAKFSFGILPIKRYRCYTCYWEGQAFDIRKEGEDEENLSDDDV